MNYTTSYAQIVKYDKNDDGTLMVFGKATDDTLDLDAQICDAAWLDEAMPAWFKSGGNIREMHGPSAAGIAKEYESKKDGHYIGVHVVDPIAAKKVETGVYQGFSIGIKSPRVVRDNKAANGRIIDGQIIEVSLVDRPANPSAKLILAKSVEGESSLVQVEELHEYKAPLPSDIAKHGDHDQSDHSPSGGGGGSDKPSGEDKPSGGDSKTDSRIEGDRTANNVSTSISDIRDELGDIEDELRDSGDNESADAIGEALDTLNDAGGYLDGIENQSEREFTSNMEDTLRDLEVSFDRMSEVSHSDAERVQNDIQDLIDEVEGFLDGYYGREEKTAKGIKVRKSAITKHGDHDQSDHSPSGGGGSDKPSGEDKPSNEDKPADVPSESGFNETDQQSINDTISGNEDISMGIDNLYDEDHDDYVEDLSEQDEEMTADAQDSIKEANEQLERAYFAKDNDARAAALDSALVRMDEAASSLRNADSRILASFADDLDSRMEEIEAVYDAILEGDDSPIKSATTTKEPRMARQRRAAKSAINKEEGMPMNGESKSIPSREEMIERYAAARKAVDDIAAECKSHGYDDVEKAYGETAEEETAEGPAVAAETAEEEVREAEEQKPADEAKAVDADEEDEDMDKEKKKVSEDDESEDDEVVKSLIEKAVKSAMDSVKVEIDTLLAEKKSAVEKSVKLESDLATALSKSVAGGPKRTATKMSDAAQNDLLVKAAQYKAKADATTDPVLAKGYRELASDFIAKASPKSQN